MSFYVILYISVILLFIYIWIVVIKRYQNLSGFFFLLFCFSTSIWLYMYFLSFFLVTDIYILQYISQSAFALSIVWIYSLLFFIIFYKKQKDFIFNKYFFIIMSCFIWMVGFYLWTPWIIEWMYFDEFKKDYYEIPWKFYILHIILSIAFLPLFIVSSYLKLKTLSDLSKVRLKYILLWAFALIFLALIFLLIFPLFWFRFFEKEIAILFLPFLWAVWHSMYRYNFSNIKIQIWKIIIFIHSVFLTVLFVNIIKYYYLQLGEWFLYFWWFTTQFGIFDLLIWICTYVYLHKNLTNIFLWWSKNNIFWNKIGVLKKEIPFITNLVDLNVYLRVKARKYFKIKYLHIELFQKKEWNPFLVFQFFNARPYRLCHWGRNIS